MSTLGGDPDRLEIPILQFVHVVERGARASMSKRRGDFVTLDDLIERDRGRRGALLHAPALARDAVDLDLDLAREQSSENPVYYVQYAHARIASILDKAGEERVAAALGSAGGLPDGVALEPAERELVKLLVAFPGEVAEAAERRAPHRIAVYALELAQDVHRLLPRLPRGRRRAGRARVLPDRPERRRPPHDRPLARPARGQRAGRDVAVGRPRLAR